jgi:hypothetical protein
MGPYGQLAYVILIFGSAIPLSSERGLMMKLAFCVGFSLVALAGSSSRAWSDASRDDLWQKLIAEAKAHGGVETFTPGNVSSSYVFGPTDASYTITLTNYPALHKRDICSMDHDLTVILCADWETQKFSYAHRDNASSPWIQDPAPEEPQSSIWGQLLVGLSNLIDIGGPIRVPRRPRYKCGIPCADMPGYRVN